MLTLITLLQTLITILTIENLNSWQSLLDDNWEWQWTAFAILAMFSKWSLNLQRHRRSRTRLPSSWYMVGFLYMGFLIYGGFFIFDIWWVLDCKSAIVIVKGITTTRPTCWKLSGSWTMWRGWKASGDISSRCSFDTNQDKKEKKSRYQMRRNGNPPLCPETEQFYT